MNSQLIEQSENSSDIELNTDFKSTVDVANIVHYAYTKDEVIDNLICAMNYVQDEKEQQMKNLNLTVNEHDNLHIYLWKYQSDEYDQYDTILHHINLDEGYTYLLDKDDHIVGIKHDLDKLTSNKFFKYCNKIDSKLYENQGWKFVYTVENFGKYNTLGKKGKWYMTCGGDNEGGYYYDTVNKELYEVNRIRGTQFTYKKIDGTYKLRRSRDNKKFFEIKIVQN